VHMSEVCCLDGVVKGVNRIKFLKQKQRIKTPVGTTDMVPVLPTGSVLPTRRKDLKRNLNSERFLAILLESKFKFRG
jgi:hypothetical protein